MKRGKSHEVAFGGGLGDSRKQARGTTVALCVLTASWRWSSVTRALDAGANQKCGGRRHSSSRYSQMPTVGNAAPSTARPFPYLCGRSHRLFIVCVVPCHVAHGATRTEEVWTQSARPPHVSTVLWRAESNSPQRAGSARLRAEWRGLHVWLCTPLGHGKVRFPVCNLVTHPCDKLSGSHLTKGLRVSPNWRTKTWPRWAWSQH